MAAWCRVLLFFSVLVVVLAAAAADVTEKRKIPTRDGGLLSDMHIEEYLEDQNRKVEDREPPVENASPLQLCILLLSNALFLRVQ